MPGRINEQDIQALRERADLGVVVGDYTALRRAGGTRLKGLCPFHAEKTPSFTVDPASGFFHCFGCDAGGDVYAFLMRVEALSFPESVERLARIVGYDLTYEELTPGQRKALGRRTRLAQAVAEAGRFYAGCLRSDQGGAARGYLATRGLGDGESTRFGVGWAPDEWDGLARHLLATGFSTDEVIDAGLATQGRQGAVDRFRGRVVFPITDSSGRDVVAFGGRVLPGVALRTGPREGKPPKYINSPETELYKKSRTLYALHWARAEAQRRQIAVVVEGYMDVIGLHLAGLTNVVATCGTALTAEHFGLLERYAPRVVLALDADDAGYAAADRARALAVEVGLREVAVLPLALGQDPADLAATGRAAVEAALEGVVTAVEFQVQHLLRTADTSTPEGQIEAYRRTFPLLAAIGDRLLRYRYVRDVVAPAVRLSADLIEAELDAASSAVAQTPRQGREGYASKDPRPERPDPRPDRPGEIGTDHLRDPQLSIEHWVLQVAIQRPDLLPESWSELREDDFRAPTMRQMFRALGEVAPGDLDGALSQLPDDEARRRLRQLAMSDLTVEPDPAPVDKLIRSLRTWSVQRQIGEVREELARVNRGTDADRQRSLSRQLMELRREGDELRAGTAA